MVNLNDESIVDNKNFNYNFNIDPFRKKFLLEGLDDIALTLEHEEKIIAYENANN